MNTLPAAEAMNSNNEDSGYCGEELVSFVVKTEVETEVDLLDVGEMNAHIYKPGEVIKEEFRLREASIDTVRLTPSTPIPVEINDKLPKNVSDNDSLPSLKLPVSAVVKTEDELVVEDWDVGESNFSVINPGEIIKEEFGWRETSIETVRLSPSPTPPPTTELNDFFSDRVLSCYSLRPRKRPGFRLKDELVSVPYAKRLIEPEETFGKRVEAWCGYTRFSKESLVALQTAVESQAVDLFAMANLCALHAGRKTSQVEDMKLVMDIQNRNRRH